MREMRSLLRLAGVVGLALLACWTGGCRRAQQGEFACRDCNLVLISVDTLRADHVGALGYPRPTTPNIDALAERGVLFENAIAQSSWTKPAHMSIFTGLHPREHGFVALGDTRPLENDVPTLASVLKDHGYRTAAFVGGVNLSAAPGFDQGFEVFRNNGKNFRDNMEDLRWWLDHRGEGRFFLFVHGYDAHTPYRNDPVDRRALGLGETPPDSALAATCRGDGPVSRIEPYIDEYDAAVHRADRYVGKLLADLGDRGLLERSVVVLLSDHGEEFLEHGRCFHIATLYREVLHVPLLFVAPGLGARRLPDLVPASVSIAPTVMDLLGIHEHPFPGPSLASLARGGPGPRGAVVSQTERSEARRGDGEVLAITFPDEKLIRWTTGERSARFDLVSDPEEKNPSAEPGPRRSALDQELDRWLVDHPPRWESRRQSTSRTGKSPTAKSSPDDGPLDDENGDERHERLRSLGYAE
jgi:arylsulfatase A-like enzyme